MGVWAHYCRPSVGRAKNSVGRGSRRSDNINGAADVGEFQVMLGECACRAVGLPYRSSLGLAREMVAWIGRTKRFRRVHAIDRGSASVLV